MMAAIPDKDALIESLQQQALHGLGAILRHETDELAILRARVTAALKVCDVIETVRHNAPDIEDPPVIRLARRIREILEGR